jgi:hypothetical protein
MTNKSDVVIYWQDIRVYHDGSINNLTQMMTEGALVKETDEYVLVKNPETLNLDKVINHPEKKPLFYYIPKLFITEISYL